MNKSSLPYRSIRAVRAFIALTAGFALVPCAASSAQTYVWSPPNVATILTTNSGNNAPFYGTSATYQQIHEAPTMPSTLIIKGLAARPSFTSQVLGRSWDLRIILSHTKVTAANASTTFANNLTVQPTTVFGTASTFTKFSWPSFTKSGTNPAFTVPFHTPFVYLAPLGNLCWEWRHKNGTSNASAPMFDVSAINDKGVALSSTGTGCTATGRAGNATATMQPVRTNPSTYQHHLEIRLANGATNAAAVLAVGLSPATVNIGWCAPVINAPLLVPGGTDGSGSWTFQAPLIALTGIPSTNVYSQFGFADPGLPGGIGLTNVAGYTTPKVPGANGIARIYVSNRSSGNELATTGTVRSYGYGVAIGWLK